MVMIIRVLPGHALVEFGLVKPQTLKTCLDPGLQSGQADMDPCFHGVGLPTDGLDCAVSQVPRVVPCSFLRKRQQQDAQSPVEPLP